MNDFLDFRRRREEVAGLNDGDFLWALMEPAWDNSEGRTRGQQVLAKVTYFCATVQNGGPITAFYNFGPEGIGEVRKGLETLGAADFIHSLNEAEQIIFPNSPPTTMEAMRAHIEALDRHTISDALERSTIVLEDDGRLQTYLRRYVDAYPTEFFRD